MLKTLTEADYVAIVGFSTTAYVYSNTLQPANPGTVTLMNGLLLAAAQLANLERSCHSIVSRFLHRPRFHHALCYSMQIGSIRRLVRVVGPTTSTRLPRFGR